MFAPVGWVERSETHEHEQNKHLGSFHSTDPTVSA